MIKLYINLDKGYTIIELLVVFGLTIVVAGFIFTGFINYSNEQRFNATMIQIKSLLRETKQKTTAAETDSQFGIYFGTSSLIVYEGVLYSNIDPKNIVYSFPDFSISPQLTGGVLEILFARLTGEPSATGSLSVFDQRSSSTRSLMISNTGLIE